VNVLSILLTLSFGGCVVYTFDPVFWWMCCLYRVKSTQHIYQKKGPKVQTTHPTKDRVKSTENTSTKRQGQKYRQHIDQKTRPKVQTTHPSKDTVNDVLSVLLTVSFDECVVCTFGLVFWWMCCLYFCPCLLVDVQTTHPPKERVKSTDNTSTKRQGQKYRQHIHQKIGSKVQTTHPPKDKVKSTDKTSTKRQSWVDEMNKPEVFTFHAVFAIVKYVIYYI
jgi:hypothetical protein